MKKKIMAVLLLSIIMLCGCGPVNKNDSSSEPAHITIYVRDFGNTSKDSSSNKVTTTTTKDTTALLGQTVKEAKAAAAITTVTAMTITASEEPEYIVFKPSTHYIHRSTCRWNDNSCQQIEDTKNIQARLCRECNPDIEIINPYVEVTTTTTTAAPQITTTTTTKAAQTTTTTTQKIEQEDEVVVSNSYRLPYVLSDDEWWWICKVVCSETGYCSERQQKAVANTIFNRLIWAAEYGNYNPYPTAAIAVIQQPGQYDAYKYWRSDLRLKPGGSLWNQTMQYIKEAASEPDFTNGAIGYYNPNMSGYLSAFENNKALLLAYTDSTGRFFKLNPACYARK